MEDVRRQVNEAIQSRHVSLIFLGCIIYVLLRRRYVCILLQKAPCTIRVSVCSISSAFQVSRVLENFLNFNTLLTGQFNFCNSTCFSVLFS